MGMSNARKFIDMAFDFIVLIVGLAVLFAGMRTISAMQDAELERTLNGAGKITYVDEMVEECSGGEVVAFLLGHDFVPVEIDGVTYESHERNIAVSRIDLYAKYGIERLYNVGEYGSPSKLVLIKH